MIRLAQSRDHQQLKSMWTRVFGDDSEAVEAYFSMRHRDDSMLVWSENGVIGGMLSMLPLTLMTGKEAYPARYIYAVATEPEQRGRGIATALLERAGELITALGEAAAVLAPASDSLFGYYEKRGYHTAFSLNISDFEGSALPACPVTGALTRCAAGEYKRVRDRAFSQSGLYACWDEQAVGYALRALGDGGAEYLSLDGGEGVAAWSRMDGAVLVRELALVDIDVPSALALLHRYLGAPIYCVRLAADAWPGAATPSGMLRWFVPPPEPSVTGYLSLTLD